MLGAARATPDIDSTDSPGALAGAAYSFAKVNELWTERSKLTASDAEAGDFLGQGQGSMAVALEGDIVAAGAQGKDLAATDSGAAYTWSISGATCKTLSGVPAQLSLESGGTQVLRFQPGASLAGGLFWGVGTISGTDPGFAIANARLPIHPDDYFVLSLIPNPASPLIGSMGTLDAQGRGLARLVVPPLSDPSLAGLRLEHAFVAYSLAPLRLQHVSNPVALVLVP